MRWLTASVLPGPIFCFSLSRCPKARGGLQSHLSSLDVPVGVNLGAALDFAAGRVLRAPRWMHKAGLEWAFRLTLEPRRLVGRYVRNACFIGRMTLRDLRRRLCTPIGRCRRSAALTPTQRTISRTIPGNGGEGTSHNCARVADPAGAIDSASCSCRFCLFCRLSIVRPILTLPLMVFWEKTFVETEPDALDSLSSDVWGLDHTRSRGRNAL